MIVLFLTFYGLIEDIADAAMALRQLGHIVHNFSLLEQQEKKEWRNTCAQWIQTRGPHILLWWCLPSLEDCRWIRKIFPDKMFVFYPWDDIYAWNPVYAELFDIVLQPCAYVPFVLPSRTVINNATTWVTHKESEKLPYLTRKTQLENQCHLFINPSCLYRDLAYALAYGKEVQVCETEKASDSQVKREVKTWQDWARLFVTTESSVSYAPEWVISCYEAVHRRHRTYEELVAEMHARSYHEPYLDYKSVGFF